MTGRPKPPELIELSDGCLAYVQPDGSWGWSNAGLVVGDGASLLVDTLFDLKLTQQMLDSFVPFTRTAPIRSLVNTHVNRTPTTAPSSINESTGYRKRNNN